MAEFDHWPTVYQLVHALHSKPWGRRTLVHQTQITEMSVRTQLNKLRAAGYVTMSKQGTALTPQGRKIFRKLFERVLSVEELQLQDLSLDRHNLAALIGGVRDAFQESWRYRDAAVREGATGALLLLYQADGWRLSGDAKPLAEQNPHDVERLERTFDARPGDGAVIAFAPTRRHACRGLWSIIAGLFPFESLKGV